MRNRHISIEKKTIKYEILTFLFENQFSIQTLMHIRNFLFSLSCYTKYIPKKYKLPKIGS